MIFKSSRALKAENEALASKLAIFEKDQAANILAATSPLAARIKELEASQADFSASIKASEEEVAEAEKAIEAAQAEAKAATDKLATVEAENKAKIANAAAIEASKIVSQVGHNPVPDAPKASNDKPVAELTGYERFRASVQQDIAKNTIKSF
jgi:hypothetical protein